MLRNSKKRIPETTSIISELSGLSTNSQTFLNLARESEITHELVINQLHAIFMVQDRGRAFYDELASQNLFEKFVTFLSRTKNSCQKLQNILSPDGLCNMLELVQLSLQIPTYNDAIVVQDIKATRVILNFLYAYISSENSPELYELLTCCLLNLRKKKADLVNEQFLTSLFLKTTGKNSEFLEFFGEYFNRSGSENFSVTSNLIRCLVLKLPDIIQAEEELNQSIISIYDSLIHFLQRQPKDSPWFLILISEENTIIFDSLKSLLNNKSNFYSLSILINDILKCYLSCSIQSTQKNEFILSFYKWIIRKVPSFFCSIETEILSNEPHFLEWFFLHELRYDKEVTEVYMSNKHALEFLAVMMIYYYCNFSHKAEQISSMMRKINLLEESKYFLDFAPLYEDLQILYEHLGETVLFQDFVNRVNDQQDSLFK